MARAQESRPGRLQYTFWQLKNHRSNPLTFPLMCPSRLLLGSAHYNCTTTFLSIVGSCLLEYVTANWHVTFPWRSPAKALVAGLRLLILNADPIGLQNGIFPCFFFLYRGNSAYRTCLNCRKRQHIDYRRHVLQPSSKPVTRSHCFFFLNGFFTAAEASAESGSPSSICKGCR